MGVQRNGGVVIDKKQREIILTALSLYKNWLETGDPMHTKEAAIACGEKLVPLDDHKQARANDVAECWAYIFSSE